MFGLDIILKYNMNLCRPRNISHGIDIKMYKKIDMNKYIKHISIYMDVYGPRERHRKYI